MSEAASIICHHPTAGKAVRSSFYWAMRLMPKAQREAMYVVYGFCREVDDIADGFDAPAIKKERLKGWREAIESLYTDEPPQQDLSCLAHVIKTYDLRKSDLMAVIDGMELDAADGVSIADEAQFEHYIDCVASAVGRLSDKVFGVEGDAADRLAHHLGRGLQITNILRDLNEDAERGRMYVPRSLLDGGGVDAQDPRKVLAHHAIEGVLQTLAARAHAHFAQARDALSALDKTKTRPARVMMAVYQRVLNRLEARGLANVTIPVKLPKWQKLWLAIYHGLV